jgi:hypothetical protein
MPPQVSPSLSSRYEKTDWTKVLAKRIIPVVIATLALTGCSNPIVVNNNKAAVQPMVEAPMEGFTLSETIEPTCGFDYCNVNPTYVFTSNSNTASNQDFCGQLMKWGQGFGVDSWLFDPEFISIPLKDHEASYQVACSLGGATLLGSSENGVRWLLSGSPSEYQITTLMNREGGIDDDRVKYHDWAEAVGLLSDGFKLNLAALDAVNTYRSENPNADPSSEETITNAIKDVDAKIELVKDSTGKVTHLRIPPDGYLLERCINIKPFNEDFFKVKNPIIGIFSTYQTEDVPKTDEFSASGECP